MNFLDFIVKNIIAGPSEKRSVDYSTSAIEGRRAGYIQQSFSESDLGKTSLKDIASKPLNEKTLDMVSKMLKENGLLAIRKPMLKLMLTKRIRAHTAKEYLQSNFNDLFKESLRDSFGASELLKNVFEGVLKKSEGTDPELPDLRLPKEVNIQTIVDNICLGGFNRMFTQGRMDQLGVSLASDYDIKLLVDFEAMGYGKEAIEGHPEKENVRRLIEMGLKRSLIAFKDSFEKAGLGEVEVEDFTITGISNMDELLNNESERQFYASMMDSWTTLSAPETSAINTKFLEKLRERITLTELDELVKNQYVGLPECKDEEEVLRIDLKKLSTKMTTEIITQRERVQEFLENIINGKDGYYSSPEDKKTAEKLLGKYKKHWPKEGELNIKFSVMRVFDYLDTVERAYEREDKLGELENFGEERMQRAQDMALIGLRIQNLIILSQMKEDEPIGELISRVGDGYETVSKEAFSNFYEKDPEGMNDLVEHLFGEDLSPDLKDWNEADFVIFAEKLFTYLKEEAKEVLI